MCGGHGDKDGVNIHDDTPWKLDRLVCQNLLSRAYGVKLLELSTLLNYPEVGFYFCFHCPASIVIP